MVASAEVVACVVMQIQIGISAGEVKIVQLTTARYFAPVGVCHKQSYGSAARVQELESPVGRRYSELDD